MIFSLACGGPCRPAPIIAVGPMVRVVQRFDYFTNPWDCLARVYCGKSLVREHMAGDWT